jgi:hypothetical protein
MNENAEKKQLGSGEKYIKNGERAVAIFPMQLNLMMATS